MPRPRAASAALSCLVSVAVLAPPARAERLTLEAIQALADERSPRLSVVRAEVDLARAERVAASPSLPDNPVLEIAIGPRLSSEGTGLAVDASLLQSVFVDGQRGRRLAAADATVEVAEAAVVAARWALHADLHHAFDRAVVARERVALEREVEGFQRRLSEVAKKKLAAGEIATLDARLSESRARRGAPAHARRRGGVSRRVPAARRDLGLGPRRRARARGRAREPADRAARRARRAGAGA